ncbi:hypothetical protein MYAM1_001884 [Malassezia yamatoensis]|uniref:Tubulin-specific chaperone D n=1 Tax=Malassezia yamatoensis TaxID=253288 RepID=A0AAJ5YX00_9BASI|nr:hypothetical protein MYAM1_001884 [Malassezia yamatoensis]
MQHEPSEAENPEVQERDDDAEREELVVFKNFDQYIAKQDEFLSLANTQNDRSNALLQELEKESFHASRTLDLNRSIEQYCRLLYTYSKVRGYKVILRFLTHNVDDVLPLLFSLETFQTQIQNGQIVRWEATYILLLWLSLVALVPFALHSFEDDTSPAARMDALARQFLSQPGKERDAASLLIGSLYRRHDVLQLRLGSFLNWSMFRMQETKSQFEATGILQALCAITKTCDGNFVNQIMTILPLLLGHLTPWESKSVILNRFRTKLVGRLAMRILKCNQDDERVDDLVDMLLTALGHSDSGIRMSAAKGIARVASQVSASLRIQIVEALVDQLHENISLHQAPEGLLTDMNSDVFQAIIVDQLDSVDVYAVSDPVWHGVFLAIAECTRRALIPNPMLCRIMYWVHRGLLFEIPRGAGSAGSNVRDACCYVLWAMARVRDVKTLAPFAHSIARRLITVSTLDRESTIRRAASAAFQEWVGRTSLVPHGIYILERTDFTAVGIRRRAYTVSAPSVAEYSFYRRSLLDHLQSRCLVHWDVDIRNLAAVAVQKIVAMEPACLDGIVQTQVQNVNTMDRDRVHGALQCLSALGPLMSDCNDLQATITATIQIAPSLFSAPGGGLILEAACRVIAAVAGRTDTSQTMPLLRCVASRPEDRIHEVLSDAIQAMNQSSVVDRFCTRLLNKWAQCSQNEQRSGALALGRVGDLHLAPRLELLCNIMKREQTADIETRRNAVSSLAALAKHCPEDTSSIVQALLLGLEDRTIDQRGDVGSWVRMQTLHCLPEVLEIACESEVLLGVCEALSAILVERIDSLRCKASEVFCQIASRYRVPEHDKVKKALDAPSTVYRDGNTAFHKLRDAGHALVKWMQTIDPPTVESVFLDLKIHAERHIANNRIFIPVLQTIQHLLEWDVLPARTKTWVTKLTQLLAAIVLSDSEAVFVKKYASADGCNADVRQDLSHTVPYMLYEQLECSKVQSNVYHYF